MSLQLFLYHSFSKLIYLLLPVVAFFSKKLTRGLQGRKKTFKVVKDFRTQNPNCEIIWFHCASLGEFEQALPLIKKYQASKDYKIAVSFFSPSGYEPKHNHPSIDLAFYLPFDHKKTHRALVKELKPNKVLVIKYEFWYYFLHSIHELNIPLYLISAYFLKHQIFFQKYGHLHRKMLSFFDCIFVQDESSKSLLQTIHINQVIVTGDTRIDNAIITRDSKKNFTHFEQWIRPNLPIFIAGSSWKEDATLLGEVYQKYSNWNWILAPHNIDENSINEQTQFFPKHELIYWNELEHINDNKGNILIINSIGQLKNLYKYADYVWIGGGFNKSGIHNLIEAAVYDNNIFIGPNYKRFKEATDLISLNGIQSISSSKELIISLKNQPQLQKSKLIIKKYIEKQAGATERIWKHIENS